MVELLTQVLIMPEERAQMSWKKSDLEKIRQQKLEYMNFSGETHLPDTRYILEASKLMNQTIKAKQEMKDQ